MYNFIDKSRRDQDFFYQGQIHFVRFNRARNIFILVRFPPHPKKNGLHPGAEQKRLNANKLTVLFCVNAEQFLIYI